MKAALRDRIEERSGLVSFARRQAASRIPAAGGVPLGGVLGFALAIQVATGALLLVHFVPDPEGAFESVRRIMREVPSGWWVRLLHAHGANWIVAIAFVQLLRAAFAASYKRPRELVWVSGVVLFLLLLASALTGYVLPWSQTSYWATTVVTSSIRYLPLVGDELARWVRGAELVGEPAFRRAFAAHVALLPLALLAVVALHLAWVRHTGLAGPARRGAPDAAPRTVAFHPTGTVRYALSCVGFAALLVGSVTFGPDLFFPAAHGMPADPFETPADVRPEWYFLWVYALPRLMPETAALALQGAAVATLFALPLLDRGEARHPLERPWIVGLLALGTTGIVGLTLLGASS